MTDRISRDEMLMRIAETVALRSTCSRASVGCVVARDGRILTMGYNGAPSGLPHCGHTCNCGATATQTRLNLNLGHKEECAAYGPCRQAVHSECNAISYAAKHGVKLNDSSLYTTMAPCLPCAQLIINAGIVSVVYVNNYRDQAGLQLLSAANVGGYEVVGRPLL